MTGLILGVDLGARDAVSLLDRDGSLIAIEDMPCVPGGPAFRETVSGVLFGEIVKRWQPSIAYCEWVGPRQGDSPKGAFSFDAAKASVETALALMGVLTVWLTPQVWKRAVQIPPGRAMKGVARIRAIQLWPAHAGLFSRECDHDRAESALIGHVSILKETASK